ncbi:MAG TPA: 4-(cytidine 5'-diphospho)-2-C-methyl-D-erythritol kinase [Candidatus Polarisedimenticolia bacterium]|nr:4-(cytidine 5'-diphospho)-2-C-methyl-D-erythritol kinase [Candidatus Polarisedimenticolia bacterium]
MRSLHIAPHAKVNLGLRILGRRPDGYHDLETRFQTIDLCDELELREHPRTLRLRVEGTDLPSDDSNLVMQAARRLRDSNPGLPGATIVLRKRIPIAAGLGGGSSNAGATLMGLNHLWDLRLPEEELRGLAASLGADVPFFLVGGCALGSGRGDILAALEDLPSCWLALVLPGFHSSTPEAFRLWDARAAVAPDREEREGSLVSAAGDLSSAALHNDFEAVLFERFPVLAEHRDRLLRLGATAAALSGSGPSLYGVFDSEDTLRRALNDPGWGAVQRHAAAPVGRAAYRRRLGIPLSD